MNIGVPKERRPYEYRVGLSPAGSRCSARRGIPSMSSTRPAWGRASRSGVRTCRGTHPVLDRRGLWPDRAAAQGHPPDGRGNGLAPDWLDHHGLLHLASTRQNKIDILLKKKVTAIAYEQIELPDGSLPVLRPFSQIGGAMAAGVAARLLQNNFGGKGVLLGGIPGVPPAEVAILGAGVVGTFAARAFTGLGAHVTVLDKSMDALTRLAQCNPVAVTMMATERNIERVCAYSDVIVGAVLVSGSARRNWSRANWCAA